MSAESGFAKRLSNGAPVVTAELLPRAGAGADLIRETAQSLGTGLAAVNVADNPFGTVTSSLAACAVLREAGVEPIYQVVSRDRNRIAIQSDVLGAATLGIGNLLCLTGYHQRLMGWPESANVYDIDSVQMIAAVAGMRDRQVLLNGDAIAGGFDMTIGAAANPTLRPLPLNLMKLTKKVEAGARFVQTQAVFERAGFVEWLEALETAGLTERVKILAGVLPLSSAEEAEELRGTFTDFVIPDAVVDRLKQAADPRAEGIAIAAEVIAELRELDGIKGFHIASGGKEDVVPELLKAAGL